ncbi:MAG: 23S rRNA (uracil(1939)-C(5))-methyltransferase RlmD [Chromatiales bacterium]|jgi:23S rRNA (uracil1939-C5)-methyltransferase
MTAAAKDAPVLAVISDLSHDGRGVATADGKTVFVDGALPGEEVYYRTRRRRRDFDEAELLEIVTPSPQRVDPRCEVFGRCGGCRLQHLSAAGQIEAKQKTLLDNLSRIGSVEPVEVFAPLTGPVWGYRRRARVGAKFVAKKGRVLVGFRERAKPFLCDMNRCEVLHPAVGHRLDALSELFFQLTIRHQIPQIEVAIADNAVVMVLRVLSAPSDRDLELMAAFAKRHEIVFYLQPGGVNTIVPLLPPAPQLYYSLAEHDIRIFFEPTDFIQVNAELNRAMVGNALKLLAPQPGESILDLFSGLGNFTLPLARSGAEVTAVEGDRPLVMRARENAERNGIAAVNIEYADLFSAQHTDAWWTRQYDAVLLDPPRAGAAAIVEHMPRFAPRKVVYISCHPGTLARDLGVLVHTHKYRLDAVGVMDMFPHTAHIESIAVLSR